MRPCVTNPKIVFLSHLDLNLYKFRLCFMKALIGLGFEVYALCPKGDCSSRFAEHGIIHVDYPIKRNSMNPLRELASLFSIAIQLLKIRPLILHTHTMKPNIYGAFAAAFAGVPIRVASVTGLGSFFIKATEETFYTNAIRKFISCLYSVALRLVDITIFLNPSDMEEFITAKIVDEKKSVLITGDGVNLDYFTRVKPRMSGQGSSANPICILMISRFIRDKGVGEFLDAAYILKQKFRDRLVVRLAGFEDPGNPWPADMVKIHKYASEGVIEFLGYRDDVRPLLEEADIYVLPSYREGLSVSILEAMAMELPIITTDVPGCRDLVVNGLNGLVIPVKDAQALAVASEKLILDSQLRYKYGLVSRNLVESRYSSKKIKNLMLSLYSKQLELKGICISGIADSFKNRSC